MRIFTVLCLLILALGCKPKSTLISKNLKIFGDFKVKYSLVREGFTPPQEWDEGLRPFFNRFVELAKKNGVTISEKAKAGVTSMRFVNRFEEDLGENTAAVCITRVAQTDRGLDTETLIWKEIQVRRTVGERYPLDSREFLAIIMHELFHCLMNREHYEGGKGVMNATLNLADFEFLTNLDLYLNKMFDPKIVFAMPVRPSAERLRSYNYGPISKSLLTILGK